MRANNIAGAWIYNSQNINDNSVGVICPIIYIPSSVKVKISTDTSKYHQSVPHIVQ